MEIHKIIGDRKEKVNDDFYQDSCKSLDNYVGDYIPISTFWVPDGGESYPTCPG